MERDFYLTLPSNVKTPGNRPSDYRTILPETIALSGQWEVSLVEIQFPFSWNNLSTIKRERRDLADNEFQVYYADNTGHTFKIKPGYYVSVLELLEAIRNAVMGDLKKLEHKKKKGNKTATKEKIFYTLTGFQIGHDYAMKKVFVHLDQAVVTRVRFSRMLSYMLGFNKRQFIQRAKTVATFPPDLRGGVESLYVYCDLVQPQLVGDVRTKLLRNVPVNGGYNEIVNTVFTAPHYIPLVKNEFSTVEISIKTDTDHDIQFAFGKVIVKLHFRKIQSGLFFQ